MMAYLCQTLCGTALLLREEETERRVCKSSGSQHRTLGKKDRWIAHENVADKVDLLLCDTLEN